MCASVLAVCILKWEPEVKVGIFITPLSFSFNFKKYFIILFALVFFLHVLHLHAVPAEARGKH